MASFEQAIEYVLENEGGDSNDAADHGGQTRFGITKKEAAAHGIEISKLTRDQAKEIYRRGYWRFDGIESQRISTKLLDMAVNMGPGTAVRAVQRILGVQLDGAFGLLTERAINTATDSGTVAEPTDLLLYKLACAACVRYADIVANDPSQVVFLRDWIGRAVKLP